MYVKSGWEATGSTVRSWVSWMQGLHGDLSVLGLKGHHRENKHGRVQGRGSLAATSRDWNLNLNHQCCLWSLSCHNLKENGEGRSGAHQPNFQGPGSTGDYQKPIYWKSNFESRGHRTKITMAKTLKNSWSYDLVLKHFFVIISVGNCMRKGNNIRSKVTDLPNFIFCTKTKKTLHHFTTTDLENFSCSLHWGIWSAFYEKYSSFLWKSFYL